jgi:uracil phosphoribosyltransferase
MITDLSAQHSLVSNWVGELRNINIQQDRQRFRRNLERIGEVAAYEISKLMDYTEELVTTPLDVASVKTMKQQPVLATILRAGLAMHNGLLNYFDKADNAFLSAYRKHNEDGSFEICLQYMSCPDLSERVLIISDPMLATGASLVKSIQYLKSGGDFKSVHIVCAIASDEGIAYVKSFFPEANIWCGAIDHKLTDKGYIVPGLGDAGDLAYGEKMQR